jgi:hypothetical protein
MGCGDGVANDPHQEEDHGDQDEDGWNDQEEPDQDVLAQPPPDFGLFLGRQKAVCVASRRLNECCHLCLISCVSRGCRHAIRNPQVHRPAKEAGHPDQASRLLAGQDRGVEPYLEITSQTELEGRIQGLVLRP